MRAAWDAWTDRWSADPNAVYTGDGLLGRRRRAAGSFAVLIGADPATIAITDNTCRAANIAIRILAERPGGNVVIDDGTYPSSAYPWYARGDREVRHVPTDGVADAAGALAERIDADTVAVCITHVAPFTGRRHDLRAIADAAHARGAKLVVDAAQSTGVVPIDVDRDGVDVLVTTAMKWLLGPPGIGFLHLRPDLLAEAPVLDVGYLGLDAPLGDWPPHTMPPILADARRYELGLPNLPGVFAARAGIELLREVGIERVFARVEELVGRVSGRARRARRRAPDAGRSGAASRGDRVPPPGLARPRRPLPRPRRRHRGDRRGACRPARLQRRGRHRPVPRMLRRVPAGVRHARLQRVTRAAVCHRFGDPMTVEEVALASPGEGEVRVRLEACAICQSDVAYAAGAWGGRVPVVLGHEACGLVAEAGPAVSALQPGQRVS